MSSSTEPLTRAQLIDVLRRSGVDVSIHQLKRWADAGLLPRPWRKGLGRGKGMVSMYHHTAVVQAFVLAVTLRRHRSLDEAGWAMWAFGFPVTRFIRALLLEEWADLERGLRHSLRELKSPRMQRALVRAAKQKRLRGLEPMLKSVRPESFARLAEIMAHIQLGTLDQVPYTTNDMDLITDAAEAMLPPELVGDPEQPEVPGATEEASQAPHVVPLRNVIQALRQSDDESLEVCRNEAQELSKIVAGWIGLPVPTLTREGFRHYFAARLVDPVAATEAVNFIKQLGWTEPPLSPLERLVAQVKAQRDQTPKEA